MKRFFCVSRNGLRWPEVVYMKLDLISRNIMQKWNPVYQDYLCDRSEYVHKNYTSKKIRVIFSFAI